MEPLDIYASNTNKPRCVGVHRSTCCVICYDCLGALLNSCPAVCVLQREAPTRTQPPISVVHFRFIHPEECWSVLCARISLPPWQRRRKQKRPRSCWPWLQSLGCTGVPGVTGPLLEGIQPAKCRRSPVFNNNHLKSLQLAYSYKEMWRGKELGLWCEIQWTFWMSAPLSHGKFKKAIVFINY